MIKTLSIIIAVIGIIAVAGWVVGIKTFTVDQDNKSLSANSNGILVYVMKEKDKAVLYKSSLTKLESKEFYIFSGEMEKQFIGASVINNKIIAKSLEPSDDPAGREYVVSLTGERIEDKVRPRYAELLNSEIESSDSLMRAFSSGEGKDRRLLVQKFGDQTIEISLNQFPHEFSHIVPLRFSPDNKYLFMEAILSQGDPGSPWGLYRFNIAGNKFDEILYSGEMGKDATESTFPVFIYLDPETRYVYTRVFADKKLAQIDINTKTKRIVVDSIDGDIKFSEDGKSVVISPLIGDDKSIRIVYIQSGEETKTEAFGQFVALSSDKNYLIYSKYYEKPRDASSSNIDHINAMEKKIQITEYHILDIATYKDTIIFTNKMVLSDSGSYVGLDGKEYSFVGLISSESK